MSLSRADTSLLHSARDLALVTLSLCLLPFSVATICLAYIARFLGLIRIPNPRPLTHDGRQPRILVTGVSMAKGLFLARSFFLGGCTVLAADFELGGAPVCGRFSSAVTQFYTLEDPNGPNGSSAYIEQVLDLVEQEEVDIWISCSGVSSAIADAILMERIEAETKCRAFQFNESATRSLDDKYQFMNQTKEFGLMYPRWYWLDTREAIKDVVHKIEKNRMAGAASDDYWIVKNVGVDDRTRGALPLLNSSDSARMIEVTGALEYNSRTSWIMQHYIDGGEEYCTHSVVVNGQVMAFVACPSSSILLHYRLVDPTSALSDAMLKFTKRYSERMFHKYGAFTGHLSFDFIVKTTATEEGVKKVLVPIECNPRCHTATIQFRGTEEALTSAYLSVLTGTEGVTDVLFPMASQREASHYWMAHDLVVLYLLPILRYCTGSLRLEAMFRIHLDFWRHVFTWKDPTFEWWDPLPWLIMNHVYWPARLCSASWNGTRWSQLNISTTKIFVI